ncbi:hypothetical protein [Streptomyces atratus]|uniref:hypothetical protein n=1 Tax=Streptomyces atratus TaxID=1893 RepID=UPI00224FD0DB|nr:hypothetical protein [Streptomyces atratus]MCX5346015.1 hypothetical protein [Streptomyces atratus]
MAAEGHPVDHDDLATITPYITHTIRRLGDLVLDPPDTTPTTRLDLEPRALFPGGPRRLSGRRSDAACPRQTPSTDRRL